MHKGHTALLSIDKNSHRTHKKTWVRLSSFGLDERGLQDIRFKSLDRLFPDGKEFTGGHWNVNHGQGEFSRGFVYTNTAESYFALLKRGVMGIFHKVSKHHLYRYCNEFSFRWNHRKVSDGERMVAAIKGVVGKRLTYRKTVGYNYCLVN